MPGVRAHHPGAVGLGQVHAFFHRRHCMAGIRTDGPQWPQITMPDQSSAATEHAILQEITRPLQALPDDPLAVIKADFPMALRGYDRVAVDDYVRRTRQLVAELQATRSPEAAVRRALERVGG